MDNRINIRKQIVYLSKKLAIFIASIFVLSVLVFCLSRLAPGDPLQSFYGERIEKMSEEQKNEAREQLGLNDDLCIQYARWFKNALQGDFGISLKYKQDVLTVISERAANTAILGGIGFILTVLLSTALGIFCAWNEDRLTDRILCKVGTVISCIPQFWMSMILILVFAVILKWFPSSGAYTPGYESDLSDRFRHLILPLAVVILDHLWYYAYIIRTKLMEEFHKEYVAFEQAKGFGKNHIIFRHCLRGILPVFLSIIAISVPHILGGTYIIETVFSYPGIGSLCYEAARYHDYNMLMVLCLMSGIIVIFCNMLCQMINERMDPRIKLSEVINER